MKAPLTNASDILRQALELVTGGRAETHGEMVPGFEQVAALWTAYLQGRESFDAPLKPSEVCDLMELLKIARRQSGAFNPDDYTDGAGYSGCSYQCRVQEGD